MVDQVTRRTPDILQAKILPIPERTATSPVEWTVLTRCAPWRTNWPWS